MEEELKQFIGARIEHKANVIDVGKHYNIPIALIKYDKKNILDKDNYSIATDFFVDMDSHKLICREIQFFSSKTKAQNKFNSLVKNSSELNIKFVGIDDWNRLVYKDKKGNLYKDVNLGEKDRGIKLCTVLNNDFYGEPNIPIKNVKINIVKSFKKDKEVER